MSVSRSEEFYRFLGYLGNPPGSSYYIRLLPPKNLTETEENYGVFPDLFYLKDGVPKLRRLKLRLQGDRLFWITKNGEKPIFGDAYEWLSEQNQIGLSPYVVVNPGGHKESEIIGSRLIFWEDDKRSKDEQLAKFDDYQEQWGGGYAVETRSSVHCYFRHDEFFDPFAASIVQLRVIREMDSDPSIWDAPRLMRLPAFDHIKLVDGQIERTSVTIIREWDGEVTKWAWIDRTLPGATDEDIAKVTGASKTHTPRPVSENPNDLRNVIQILPHYASHGADWVSAAIPKTGVTSTDGFQVNLKSGGFNVYSSTVGRWEALKVVAEYAHERDPRVDLDGILKFLRDKSEEPDPEEWEEYQAQESDREKCEQWEQVDRIFALPESDLQAIFQAPILAKLNEQRKTTVATAKSAVEAIAKTVFPAQYAKHEAALGRRLSSVEKRKVRSDWTKEQIQQYIETNYPEFDRITLEGDELRQCVLALSTEKGLSAIIEHHSQWQQRKREEWQRQKYREAARGQWEKTKSYTPDRTINARFVSDEITLKTILDSNAHIFGLKAGMGTGKTHALAKILKQWDSGAMAIGYRNSLLLQSCERWGNFYHLRDDDASSLLADPNARIAFCIDSILKAKPEDCRGKIIILDESTSIIKHGLFSSTLGDRRGQILEHFEQCIKEAAVILAWDGRNADIYINYLAALRGENARAVKFYNEATATKLDVEIVRSVGRAGVCHQDYGAVLGQIDSVLTDIWSATAINDSGDVRTSVVIISDSQTLCESMDRKLSGMGYRVLRIDSKTIRDEQIKEILKNPDAYLTDHPEIDVLILSPTAESGIDVSIKNRFACGFAFFFGVVDTDSQMQFMRRVRDCTRWSVHIPEYLTRDDEGLKSPFAQQLTKELLDYLEKDAAAAIEGGDQESLAAEYQASLKQTINTEHAKTYLKLRAARNYEKSALQECLKECLERDGHTINVVEVARDDAAAESYKEAKLEVLQEEAQAIFYADIEECGDDWDAKVQWAIDQRSRFGASLADERRAQKIMLLHQIPGITETPFWTWELVYRLKFDDRSLLTKLRRWWLLHHMDVAKQQAGDRWQAVIENGRFIGDIKSDYRYLQAIDRIGIPTLCDAELHNGSEELIEIHTRVKRSKNLQVALRRSAGKSPVALANALARSVGMTIEDKQGSTRGDRKRYYTYASPESDALLSTLLDCLNTKFNLLQQKRQEKIDREAELNASANSSASSFDEGMSQSNVVALRQPQVIQSPVSVAHSPPRTVEDTQVVTMVKPFPCSPIVPGEYTVSKRNGDGMVKLLVNGEEYPIWIAPAFFSNIEHQQEVKVG